MRVGHTLHVIYRFLAVAAVPLARAAGHARLGGMVPCRLTTSRLVEGLVVFAVRRRSVAHELRLMPAILSAAAADHVLSRLLHDAALEMLAAHR